MSNILLVPQIFIVFFLSLSSFGQANEKSIILGKNIPFSVYLSNKNQVSISAVIEQNFNFKDPEDFNEKTNPEDVFWIKLDLKGLLSRGNSAEDFYLKLNIFDSGAIFFLIDGIVAQKAIGQFDTNTVLEKIDTSYYYSFIPFNHGNLIENRYLIIKAQRLTFNEDIKNWHFEYSQTSPNSYVTTNDFHKQVLYYFFGGLCFIMWFSTLSFFFLLRKREYLYYSIYIVVTFIYLAGKKFGIYHPFFGSNSLIHWISQSFLILANLSYVNFFISFLQTRKNYPFVHKICKLLVWLNMLTLIFICIFHWTKKTVELIPLIMYSFQITCGIALFGILYLLSISRSQLVRIVATASLGYAIGPLVRIYLAEPGDGLYLNGINYVIIGVSLEMVIFAFGLNYKFY